jgi:hypothetical protein
VEWLDVLGNVIFVLAIVQSVVLDQLWQRQRAVASEQWERDGCPKMWFRKGGPSGGPVAARLLVKTPDWIGRDGKALVLHRWYQAVTWVFIALVLAWTVLFVRTVVHG